MTDNCGQPVTLEDMKKIAHTLPGLLEINFECAAEQIVKVEGLTFALAIMAGKSNHLAEARGLLRQAIIRALVTAFEQGSMTTLRQTEHWPIEPPRFSKSSEPKKEQPK